MSVTNRCFVVSSPQGFPPGTIWLLLVLLFCSGAMSTPTAATSPRDLETIRALVDELRGRLSIPEEVGVSLVPTNPLLVSVEPLMDRPGVFLLRLQQDFLEGLNDDELTAVLAHELGHVWIFTHHPFLQTEQLANRIAMRLVSREILAAVYGKVWERDGSKGDLSRFLGQDNRRLSESNPNQVHAETR